MSESNNTCSRDNLLRFQINDCTDLEETLHVLTGVLSQSVVDSVISESTELMNDNMNLNNVFSIQKITSILKKRWEHNLKKMPGAPFPDAYLDSNINKNLSISKFLTERITPINNVQGVKGKPSTFMIAPESCNPTCDSDCYSQHLNSSLKSTDNLYNIEKRYSFAMSDQNQISSSNNNNNNTQESSIIPVTNIPNFGINKSIHYKAKRNQTPNKRRKIYDDDININNLLLGMKVLYFDSNNNNWKVMRVCQIFYQFNKYERKVFVRIRDKNGKELEDNLIWPNENIKLFSNDDNNNNNVESCDNINNNINNNINPEDKNSNDNDNVNSDNNDQNDNNNSKSNNNALDILMMDDDDDNDNNNNSDDDSDDYKSDDSSENNNSDESDDDIINEKDVLSTLNNHNNIAKLVNTDGNMIDCFRDIIYDNNNENSNNNSSSNNNSNNNYSSNNNNNIHKSLETLLTGEKVTIEQFNDIENYFKRWIKTPPKFRLKEMIDDNFESHIIEDEISPDLYIIGKLKKLNRKSDEEWLLSLSDVYIRPSPHDLIVPNFRMRIDPSRAI